MAVDKALSLGKEKGKEKGTETATGIRPAHGLPRGPAVVFSVVVLVEHLARIGLGDCVPALTVMRRMAAVMMRPMIGPARLTKPPTRA